MPVPAPAPARSWRRALRRWLGVGAVAVTSVAAAGCGDTVGPGSRELVGQYSADVLLLDYTTFQEDLIQEGAYLDIELHSNGETTGELFVPNGAENGGDLYERMDGTWRRNGDVVTFSQNADTFVRDMDFFVQGDQLVGDEFFGNVRVRAVLTRYY